MERSNQGKGQSENVQRSTSNAQRPSADKSLQEILTILHKWGIHTLGQLAALDKEQLAARLGPEAIHMWERATGQSTRVLKLVRPTELFQESFEFENEIETAEPLLFMLRRFVEQLALRLDAIYLVAKELTLVITFANPPQNRTQDGFVRRGNGSAATPHKQIYERVFKIPQPTNDVDLLFRMLQTHLENFKSEYPIVAVALSAQPIKPAREQFGLFETTLRNPHQLSETLARFIALLGADRVGTPVLEETHRPDAFRIEPFSWAAVESPLPSRQSPHSGSGSHALRTAHTTAALRRFRPGASASVLMDGYKPAHILSPEFRGNVIEHRGPYFISGNWWDEKSWTRAEWDLQLENGQLVRVHESPPSPSSGMASEGSWKVDGVYD
jgi:protein ImuB